MGIVWMGHDLAGPGHSHDEATAPAEGGREGAPLRTWPLDRIAEQLVTGYWGASAPYAFDPGSDRALRYDVSGLDGAGRALARAALAEWAEATGLSFREVPGWRPSALLRERGDAAASALTIARAAVGEAFEGSIAAPGDRDWIRIDLAPEEVVTLVLTGKGGLGAPRALLRDMAGAAIPFAWTDDGATTEVTITADDRAASVHVEVAGHAAAQGAYRLELRAPEDEGAADIVFGDDRAGAYAALRASGGEIRAAEVNVAGAWIASYGTALGSYGFQTYLHEIGHALGLGHAGHYNGSARYERDALFANDSWQATVMSYFDQAENPALRADRAHVVTPMAADILAARLLYGPAPAREGDTVYGEGSTAGGALDRVASSPVPLAFTIHDTGGRDLLNLASQAADQRVDLRAEAVSDVFGHRGTMTISRGTVIEDVAAGSGDDALVGNGAANRLSGGAGDDDLAGRGGHDRLLGGAGEDRLRGGPGADRLHGGPGDDDLRGGSGADGLVGGRGADHLRGGAGPDELAGGRGSDRLVGGAGDDHLRGGRQEDALIGQAGDDTLRGGVAADRLWGGPGADRLTGGRGHDLLRGGDGDDVLRGAHGRDVIVGGPGADRLAGGPGADTLRGGAGHDALHGGRGRDRIEGGTGDDVLTGGAGADRFVFAGRFGRDRVEDFAPGLDGERLDLAGVEGVDAFGSLDLRRVALGVVIDLAEAGRILLAGIAPGDLDAGDFLL